MEKLDIPSYKAWLAQEKASLLSLVETTFLKQGKKISLSDLEQVVTAFDIAAICHGENEKRDSGEYYVTHPIAVARILLEEFQDTNINQILIALLHDTIEAHPKFKKNIAKKLSKPLAEHVSAISKKDPSSFLPTYKKPSYQLQGLLDKIFFKCISIIAPTKQDNKTLSPERKLLQKTLKALRDHDYFSGLDDLHYDELCVKIADRLHNLRTIYACDVEKQKTTTEGTYKYFLSVVEKRCPGELDLLANELLKITKHNIKQRTEAFLSNNGVDPVSFYGIPPCNDTEYNLEEQK